MSKLLSENDLDFIEDMLDFPLSYHDVKTAEQMARMGARLWDIIIELRGRG